MIEVKNLYKRFDEREVLKDINTVFEDGKTNLIIGQSGSGKTVLMKNLVGLFEPTSGQVLYDGRDFVRMTKQEIKDEYKQTEGDPKIKGQIRQKMREASQRRMMQKLPEADVVITNPTHLACAIKYDRETAEAPVLIAKGADYLAQKIKEAARENFIPIVENKPLARMLYHNVELDEEIPQELYQMTAEVLAYVYSINGKAG